MVSADFRMTFKQFPMHWILVWSVTIVVLASGYKYLVAHNYDFLVEAACDGTTEDCYVRDCAVDYCPPNELELYTVYRVPADSFGSCSDNECSNVCRDGGCEELRCSSQEDADCSGTANE